MTPAHNTSVETVMTRSNEDTINKGTAMQDNTNHVSGNAHPRRGRRAATVRERRRDRSLSAAARILQMQTNLIAYLFRRTTCLPLLTQPSLLVMMIRRKGEGAAGCWAFLCSRGRIHTRRIE